ncbi:MAG: FKBP-type peptidyl-prolyl cis-trans isomerase N-terminal domain-containing protein, partial [Oceanisphaera sp.]|nr:FKBP-type peptidyl-prolyl cis-trans isomerase N-terminal domain-containing protein [Oceanisphaera sp.]
MKFFILAVVILVVGFYIIRNSNHKKAAVENIAAANEFLAQNKTNDDVQETASGLQYQILTKGDGTVHPSAKSTVTVHYHGTLLDGTV